MNEEKPPQLKKPVEGFAISTSFGRSGGNWKSGFHKGVDYPCPTGTIVKAAWDGVVSWAGDGKDGFGLYIKIEHNWKEVAFRTYYAHLSETKVAPGQEVKIGEPIGLSGHSGNVVASNPASDGSHLHFEMRVGKESVCPKFYDQEDV